MTELTNPFPGLRAFEPHEEHLFFGRDTQIDEVLKRLRMMRFLCVIGFSGSGKSSLIRSGVVPALFSGRMAEVGSQWRVSVFRPGSDPIGNMARGLWEPVVFDSGLDDLFGEDDGDETDCEASNPENELMNRAMMRNTLERSSRGLIKAVRRFNLEEGERQLLVVDQFEELFRFRREAKGSKGHNESIAFVKLLLAATQQQEAPIYVILTMRSDFLESCTAIPGLTEAINQGQYLIPRMTREQRREAIVGPVSVSGAKIAPRLITRLLNDVGDSPDQLPILQHALMRTWDFWHRNRTEKEPVNLRHYEAIGTMKEALSRHAEEAYHEGGDEDRKRTIRKVFTCLTEKGRDGRGIRRPSTLAEIRAVTGESAENVLQALARFRAPDCSFLFPPEEIDVDSDTVLDISHESLMRVWERLRRWVDAEAQSAELYRNLAHAAARCQQGTGGLYHDPELQMALRWREETRPNAAWASRYEPGFERAMVFLDRSLDERNRIAARQERLQQIQLRRTRIFARVSVLFTLIVLGLGAFSFFEARLAKRERSLAEEKRIEAELARRETDQALALLADERNAAIRLRDEAQHNARDADAARLLAEQRMEELKQAQARAELRHAEAVRARNETDQALAVAREATREAELAKTKAEHEENKARKAEREVHANLKHSRDLMTLELARELAGRVPNLAQRDPELAGLAALKAYELARDHSPNNQFGMDDSEIHAALGKALDAMGAGPEYAINGRDALRALAIGDRFMFAGNESGELLRIDLGAERRQPQLIHTFPAAVRSLALDPTGVLLAIGSVHGDCYFYDLKRETPPFAAPIEAHHGAVNALAFSPDGRFLASGGADGLLRLHAIGGESNSGDLRGAFGPIVADLAFNSDGSQLLAAGPTGVGLVSHGETGLKIERMLTRDPATAVAFSSDGALLAAGLAAGEVYIWETGLPQPRIKRGHLSAITDLCFSPNSQMLCSASLDRSLRLWQTRNEVGAPLVLRWHRSWVRASVYSPGGDLIYSAAADQQIRRWATSSEQLAGALCGRISRKLTPAEWEDLIADTLSAASRETLGEILALRASCSDQGEQP